MILLDGTNLAFNFGTTNEFKSKCDKANGMWKNPFDIFKIILKYLLEAHASWIFFFQTNEDAKKRLQGWFYLILISFALFLRLKGRLKVFSDG